MMTTLKHDESIEALAGNNKMAENGHRKSQPGASTNQEEDKQMLPKVETDSEKQQQFDHKRRIARVKKLVFVISGILILMAVILVGVTLFMAGHIDEEVRRNNDGVTIQPEGDSNAGSRDKTSTG